MSANANAIYPTFSVTFSSVTSSSFTPSSRPAPLSGLLALHNCREDYVDHCMHIANWSLRFMGLKEFPGLPDRFSRGWATHCIRGFLARTRVKIFRLGEGLGFPKALRSFLRQLTLSFMVFCRLCALRCLLSKVTFLLRFRSCVKAPLLNLRPLAVPVHPFIYTRIYSAVPCCPLFELSTEPSAFSPGGPIAEQVLKTWNVLHSPWPYVLPVLYLSSEMF